MKKIALAALAVFFMTAFVSAEIGIGAKIGAGSSDSDFSKIEDNSAGLSYEYTDDASGLIGLEVLFETDSIIGPKNFLGAKLGYTWRGEEEFKYSRFDQKFTGEYFEVPVTVYFKHAFDSGWALSGGVGAAFGSAEAKASGDDSETIKKSKAYPFIALGGEYRFSKLFALGLDLKFNMGAEFKKDNFVIRDVSGVEGALAARFYF